MFSEVNMSGGDITKVSTIKPWTKTSFKILLRERLNNIGVGSSDSLRFSEHSIKRGLVQLYGSLGLRDEMSMEKYK